MDDLPEGVTRLLDAVRAGSDVAAGELLEQIYPLLRRQAGDLMRRERGGHTLEPTALVHEALVKLLQGGALASVAGGPELFKTTRAFMRYVLVSHARARRADKRGGGAARVPLDEALDRLAADGLGPADLHDAVERLAARHERPGRVVTLRFFLGFTAEETAEQLGVSVGTVENDFRFARAWLRRALAPEGGGS